MNSTLDFTKQSLPQRRLRVIDHVVVGAAFL